MLFHQAFQNFRCLADRVLSKDYFLLKHPPAHSKYFHFLQNHEPKSRVCPFLLYGKISFYFDSGRCSLVYFFPKVKIKLLKIKRQIMGKSETLKCCGINFQEMIRRMLKRAYTRK